MYSYFQGKDGPGPGEYEPYRPPENLVEHLNMEPDSARIEPNLPRYHEIIVKEEEKKVGQRMVISQFECKFGCQKIIFFGPPIGECIEYHVT